MAEGIGIIERARLNIGSEQAPINQELADSMMPQLRRDCVELLDRYGKTRFIYPKWMAFNPLIALQGLFQRIKPMEVIQERRLGMVFDSAEPPVMVTISGGYDPLKSDIKVSIQGIGEILNIDTRNRGLILPTVRAYYPLRQADLGDATAYQEVIAHFADKYNGSYASEATR